MLQFKLEAAQYNKQTKLGSNMTKWGEIGKTVTKTDLLDIYSIEFLICTKNVSISVECVGDFAIYCNLL